MKSGRLIHSNDRFHFMENLKILTIRLLNNNYSQINNYQYQIQRLLFILHRKTKN